MDKNVSYTRQVQKQNSSLMEGLERTTDPVKIYLREMGNISLL
ncbi:unnamed protein product, partial [marine sediment metagenome]